MSSQNKQKLAEAYLKAKETVMQSGFAPEIHWQATRCLDQISESEFLQEAAWVILNSGMKEAIVRRLFAGVSASFLNWKSAVTILQNEDYCTQRSLSFFNHQRKISAILSMCHKVEDLGFEAIRCLIYAEGTDFLRTFDYIGPITCYHLAKNIGLEVVKPDRHLVRISKTTGFRSPNDLCHLLSEMTGDKVTVIDIVLWRYATINANYFFLVNMDDKTNQLVGKDNTVPS